MRPPALAFIFAALLLHGLVSLQAQIPAFPGAEGFGKAAKGGRGGDVYHVTNLNSSGAGSLSYGITSAGSAGRTIVFDVSGYIHVPGSNLRITTNKITIAGQTAPGDGVGLRDGTFRISGDDIVIRHLRFRHGKNGSGGDCIDLDSLSVNSILDHISMQFSTDENISSFGSPPENLTLQYSLNSWGLESHSCGGLWDQNHASSHHNLWSHNHTRNPKARPNGLLEWINNVTFDWDIGFIMGDSQTPAAWKANVINNYFICPPGNTQSRALVKGTLASNNLPNFTVHLGGNLTDNDGDLLLDGTDKGYSIVEGQVYSPTETPAPAPGAFRYYQSASPIAGATGVTTDAPLLAYKKIVSSAGALRLDAGFSGGVRDEVDTILIGKLTSLSEGHVTRESDTGASASGFGTLNSTAAPVDSDQDGVPDFFEAAVGWSSTVDDHNTAVTNAGGFVSEPTFFPPNTAVGTATLDKYTRLEEYLHFRAIPHAVVARNIVSAPTSIDVDLRKYTLGFNNSPVFTVSNVVNGTVTQSGVGGYLVHFVPSTTNFAGTSNPYGRAKFDFAVVDGAGLSWTQRFAILVSENALPRDLAWIGGQSSNAWDGAANNWLLNGVATNFGGGDRVTFDDSGSRTPAVNVSAAIAPGSVDVDAAGNYTFSGTGAIGSTGPLNKRGAGTLSINNTGPNAFSAVTIEAGTLTIGANALGTGPLNILGGNLNIGANATTNSVLNILGATTITGGSGGGTTGIGALSGSAPLTIAQTNVFDLRGDMTAYTGTLAFTGNALIRMNGSLGSAAATFDLGSGTGSLAKRSGVATITLGALRGGSGTSISGATGSGNTTTTTYVIGDAGISTIFAGAISNGGATTGITKGGGGILTLTGTSSYSGATSVNSGTLAVNGSLGATALNVASGATLAGTGAIGGTVSVAGGGRITPGAPDAVGTLTANAVTLNSATLVFDLSANPASGNDRITLNGGVLGINGTQNFEFNLLDGVLGAGTYALIGGGSNTSASGPGLASNLPAGSRQTFSLQRPASGNGQCFINLVVGGTAATLNWLGGPGNVWDTNSTVNWSGAPDGNNKFLSFDAVAFGDGPASGNVTILGGVRPRTLTVTNSALNYTFTGGTIAGGGALVKNGTGTLTLAPTAIVLSSTTTVGTTVTADTTNLAVGMNVFGDGIATGAIIAAITNATTLELSLPATAAATVDLTFLGNSYTGGTFLNGGTIVLANDLANTYGLGTGPVTFANGTTLTMYANNAGDNTARWSMVVPASVTATLNADARVVLTGALTGAGTLNLRVPYIRTDVVGDWSDFTGTINVTTDGDGGEFRFGTNYSYAAFPQATIALPAKIAMYYLGILAQGTGTAIEIGALSGVTGSFLYGGQTSSGGRLFTYRIGGKGTDATFAGAIREMDAAVTNTSFVKTGAGVWTLSGVCSYNGNTTVEQGTLRITGTLTTPQAIDVKAGAILSVQSGTITTDAVNIATGATLTGAGTLNGDLNNNGTVTATSGGAFTVTGAVVNNGTLRIAGGTALSATGGFVNNGVLDLLTAAQGLPPNLENNGIVIDSTTLRTVAAAKSGNTVTVTVQGHSGHSYQLQRADSLTAPGWANVSGSVGAGTTQPDGQPTPLALQDANATGSQRYYRVVVTP